MQAGCRWLILLLALGLGGCRNRDLIENQLRARDFQLRDALDELKKLEYHNEALQREIGGLRLGDKKLPPEQAAQLYGLQRIVLGRLTGGYDEDNIPGDEALQVIVEPRDGADHLLKTPGNLHVTVLEIHPQGLKKPLDSWDFDAEKLRKHWKSGLISSGYVLVLPWHNWPQFENLRVVVQFMLSDGRMFEADKDVKVRLVPASEQKVLPLDPVLPIEPMLPADTGPTIGGWTTLPASVVVPAAQWQMRPAANGVQLGQPVPLSQPRLEVVLP